MESVQNDLMVVGFMVALFNTIKNLFYTNITKCCCIEFSKIKQMNLKSTNNNFKIKFVKKSQNK